MRYFIDQKVLSILNQGLSNQALDYTKYVEQLLIISTVSMGTFLQSKGYDQATITAFLNNYMQEVPTTKDEDNVKQEVELNPAMVALVKSDECYKGVSQDQDSFNRSLYDLARPNLSQAQKDELNRYLDGVESEMKQEAQDMQMLIKEYDKLIAKVESLEQEEDADASQQPADQTVTVKPDQPAAVEPTDQLAVTQPVAPATSSAEGVLAVPKDSATSPAEEPPTVAQAEVAPVLPPAEQAPISPAAPATPSQPAVSTTPPAQVNTDNPGVVKPIDTFPAQ